jgi:hypothetical protein
VFEFSEEYSRLHQFIRRSAWKTPIALLCVSHLNLINMISSIAQHYGVGLDVIRCDHEADEITAQLSNGINQRDDAIIKKNCFDHTAQCMETQEQKYAKLHTLSTSYLAKGNVLSDVNVPPTKLNYIHNQQRQTFQDPDKKLKGGKEDDPVYLVEQAAKAGSWILVSTVRFPQFWKRLCDRLAELNSQGKVDDNFRLMFDLQGFSQNDISDSFLFDHCLPFHITEQNMEEFEGFEDVWSAILDERVLIKLEEKVNAMKELMIEEEAKAAEEEGKSET